MNLDLINNLSNIILLVHTLVLYPILKYTFNIEKRLTILETKENLK